MNEAIISGNLDFASGGVGPLLTIWSKTRGNLGVKGVAALNAMPLDLNSNNPNVKTIKDFTDKDRIALPGVKVSIQAVTLQMAAEKVFGRGQYDKLDSLTVTLGHPDGMAQLLSGKSEITAHFTSAPFMYQELDDKRIHKVLDSYEVLGGPHTFNVVWATAKLHDESPKVVQAFLAALDDAMKQIAKDPAEAAELWVKNENSKIPVAEIERMIRLPENRMDHGAEADHVLRGFHEPCRLDRGKARAMAGRVLRGHPQAAGKLSRSVIARESGQSSRHQPLFWRATVRYTTVGDYWIVRLRGR